MTDRIEVGSQLPPLRMPPITRTTLALYAGASGDHNPIHIDSDFAKGSGMPDVIAHGMLSMAYLGRLLTNWRPQSQLRHFSSRFVAITELQEIVTCSGEVTELFEAEGESRARLTIQAAKADGTPTLLGEAVVAL